MSMTVSELLSDKAKQASNATLFTVGPEVGVAEAVALMTEKAISSVIVVDGGEMLGLITLREILAALNQQGGDRGISYRSAIFYANEGEKKEAEDFIKIVDGSKRWKDPVVTTLEPLGAFYKAEEYHQDYLQKNPGGYTCHAIYFDSYLK